MRSYQETYMQKKNRMELEKNNRRQQERREMKREIIGGMIFMTIMLVVMYHGIWMLWSVTPPHWW